MSVVGAVRNAKPGGILPLSIDLGMLVLVALLPFHLAIKRVVPGPLGTYWKEALLLALLIVWLAGLMRRGKRLERHSRAKGALDVAVAIFLAYLLLRFLLDVVSGPSLFMSAFGLYIVAKYIPAYFLVASSMRVRAESEFGDMPRLVVAKYGWRMLSVLLAAGTASALGGILEFVLDRHFLPSEDIKQIYGAYDLFVYGTTLRRVYFTFDSPAALGSYLAIGLLVAVALFPAVRSRYRWLIAASVLPLSVGLALTFSRGPWIGLVLGLLFIAAIHLVVDRGRKIYYALACMLSIAFVFFLVGSIVAVGKGGGSWTTMATANPIITHAFTTGQLDEPSNVPRVEAWRRSVEVVRSHLLLGIGLGRTGAAAYRARTSNEVLVTESEPLKMAVETGLPGLAAFLAVWLVTFYVGISAYRRCHDNRLRAVLLGSMAALVSVFANGLAFQVMELKQTDLAVWLLVAIVGSSALQVDSRPSATTVCRGRLSDAIA